MVQIFTNKKKATATPSSGLIVDPSASQTIPALGLGRRPRVYSALCSTKSPWTYMPSYLQLAAYSRHRSSEDWQNNSGTVEKNGRIIKPNISHSKSYSYLSCAGSESNATMARHAECKLHAGDHSFFKISKQISPDCRQRDTDNTEISFGKVHVIKLFCQFNTS